MDLDGNMGGSVCVSAAAETRIYKSRDGRGHIRKDGGQRVKTRIGWRAREGNCPL